MARGRPKLSDEEKAKRKAEREALKAQGIATDKPKRKRRTKAEIEADKLNKDGSTSSESNTTNSEEPFKDTRPTPRETVIHHDSDSEWCYIYSTERWGREMCKSLLEKYPNDCELINRYYDENDKEESIEIRFNYKGMKYIHPPATREMSEEDREKLRERAKKMREARLGKKEDKESKE